MEVTEKLVKEEGRSGELYVSVHGGLDHTFLKKGRERNIKLYRPLLFLDVLLDHLGNQLLGHLHDYDGLLPSR